MNTPLIHSSSFRTPVSHLCVVALLTALAGCGHSPTHYAGTDLTIIPAADLPANFTAPTPVRTVAPVFPYDKARNGIEGSAEVLCLVDENGTVQDARYLSATDVDFAQSAVAAAVKWSFAPGTYNGARVPIPVMIPFTFAFERDQPKRGTEERLSRR